MTSRSDLDELLRRLRVAIKELEEARVLADKVLPGKTRDRLTCAYADLLRAHTVAILTRERETKKEAPAA